MQQHPILKPRYSSSIGVCGSNRRQKGQLHGFERAKRNTSALGLERLSLSETYCRTTKPNNVCMWSLCIGLAGSRLSLGYKNLFPLATEQGFIEARHQPSSNKFKLPHGVRLSGRVPSYAEQSICRCASMRDYSYTRRVTRRQHRNFATWISILIVATKI